MAAGPELARGRFLLRLALANSTPPRVPQLRARSRTAPAAPPPPPPPAVQLLPIEHTDPYQLSFSLVRAGAPGGIVTIDAHDDDDWQSSLYTSDDSGFSDLYEPVRDLGDAAVWSALVHTLRVRSGVRRVTVELDLPFGADPLAGELELACDAARAALDWR